MKPKNNAPTPKAGRRQGNKKTACINDEPPVRVKVLGPQKVGKGQSSLTSKEAYSMKLKEGMPRPKIYPMRSIFGVPWGLRFDRNGTEDIADICQSRGNCILATSREFWRPEYKGEKVPGTLACMRLMVTAPKLLQALYILLARTADAKANGDFNEGLRQARATALRVIAEALYPAEELNCENREDEAADHWLGGPVLPYDIGGLR